MSIDALSWAFNMDLPGPATKLTLLALANYANEDHESYPSQKTISKRTCLSERAIRKHLVILEELGILTRIARKRVNGTFTSDLFKLQIGAKTCDKVQRHEVPQAQDADGRPCPDQRHVVPPPAARGAGQEPSLKTTVTEPVEEDVGALPHGVTKESWEGFLEVRRKKGKEPTERAVKLLFKTLGEFQAQGQDVNAVLEQSTVNEWINVYPIKTENRAQSQPLQRPRPPARPEKFDPVAFVNRNATRRERDVTGH